MNDLKEEIKTLSQRIAMLVGAPAAKNKQDVLFWFSAKNGIIHDLIEINHKLDLILIEKLKN